MTTREQSEDLLKIDLSVLNNSPGYQHHETRQRAAPTVTQEYSPFPNRFELFSEKDLIELICTEPDGIHVESTVNRLNSCHLQRPIHPYELEQKLFYLYQKGWAVEDGQRTWRLTHVGANYYVQRYRPNAVVSGSSFYIHGFDFETRQPIQMPQEFRRFGKQLSPAGSELPAPETLSSLGQDSRTTRQKVSHNKLGYAVVAASGVVAGELILAGLQYVAQNPNLLSRPPTALGGLEIYSIGLAAGALIALAGQKLYSYSKRR